MPVPTKLIDRNFGLLVFYEAQKVNELLSNIFKLLYKYEFTMMLILARQAVYSVRYLGTRTGTAKRPFSFCSRVQNWGRLSLVLYTAVT